MRIFLWLLAFLAVVVLSSFISWAVEYATDSIFWMVATFVVALVAGCAVLLKLFLRQDDLNY